MNKIRYEDFKKCDKYNLKTSTGGKYICGKTEVVIPSKIIINQETIKIVLTKKDDKECDLLNITSPGEDIKYFQFNFYHFNYLEKKWYKISIEWKKEKQKLLESLIRLNHNRRKWEIQISEIEEGGIKKRNGICNTYPDGSGEVMDIKKILLENERQIEEKIVDLVNCHNYNNCIGIKNNNRNLTGNKSLNFILEGEEADAGI